MSTPRCVVTAVTLGVLFSVCVQAQTIGYFTPTGSMRVARAAHQSVTLFDGRVLVLGPDMTSELYDPALGQFSDGPAIPSGVTSATLLNDGRVLLLFSSGPYSSDPGFARIYDPSPAPTGTITVAGAYAVAQNFGAAVVKLMDGRVLVAGGHGPRTGISCTADSQIFDPSTNSFTATGAMAAARYSSAAAMLADGRVLIAGGGCLANQFSSTELFDPSAAGGVGAFSAGPPMRIPRENAKAARFPNGNILISPGYNGGRGSTGGVVEILDVAANTFSEAVGHADDINGIVQLPDGSVLVMGSSTGRVYSPAGTSATSLSTAPMSIYRSAPGGSLALFGAGKVLVTGGASGGYSSNSSAEIFNYGESLAFSSDTDRVFIDQAVKLTATAFHNDVTGSVSFRDGGSSFASSPLVNGVATLTTKLAPVGRHVLTAAYAGDATHAQENSQSIQEIVYGERPGIGVGDFNGDGRSDILWRHPVTGEVGMWLMDGSSIIAGGSVGCASPQTRIVGIGDFDGDGKSDILWKDTFGGVGMWFMNGTSIRSGALVEYAPIDTEVAGIGDFNGDGKSDILWRDASGGFGDWCMNGSTIVSSRFFWAMPAGIQVVAIADLDGDGNDDVLFHSDTYSVWMMKSGTRVDRNFVGWGLGGAVFAGIGDFDGDGIPEALFRRLDDDVLWRWRLAAGDFNALDYVGKGSSMLTIRSVADYDGDGKADILWTDLATGTVGLWIMNGPSITTGRYIAAAPLPHAIQ